MENLWGFEKLDKKDIKSMPQGVIKEQADLFERKTDGKLYIKISTRNLPIKADVYGMATNFEIIAPFLDSYSYTLFTMFSQPEKDYPVAIATNTNSFDPPFVDFDYECENEEEFIKSLKKILSSDETTSVVRNLYSKSFINVLQDDVIF